MGSNIISKAQAAKLMGVSIRTLYYHIENGRLRVYGTGRKAGVSEDEVLRLMQDEEEPVPIEFTKANFQKVYRDLQYVMSRLHTLERIYDVKLDRLNLSDKELHQLYEAAKNYGQEGWPPHVEQTWADTFLRLNHDDLRQLQDYIKEDHPWKPFLLLCGCMHQAPYNKFLKDQFNVGRHHLQNLVTYWGQLRGESPTIINAMVRDEAEPMRRLINKLQRDKNPAGSSPF
jgi:excisionase family DNA binding protein